MTEAERSHQGSYDRGVEQGKVLERLEGHDEHFRRINGSIDKSAERMASLENTMDRMVNLITNSSSSLSSERAETPEPSRTTQSIPGPIILMGAVVIVLLILVILLEMT